MAKLANDGFEGLTSEPNYIVSNNLVWSVDGGLDWGWAGSGSTQETKVREMIPNKAVLTIAKEDAEAQRALFADLPSLSPREKKMMAIYDSVLAGEKIIKLQEVLNQSEVYSLGRAPKVVLAPVNAESVTYNRTVTRRRRAGTRVIEVSSGFTSGKWQMNLLVKSEADTFGTRVTEFTGEALTPLIPPPHRDKVQDGDLLLWEPVWLYSKEVVINADPAILRPLSHGLYKVVAAWDLTPVETMMLSGE